MRHVLVLVLCVTASTLIQGCGDRSAIGLIHAADLIAYRVQATTSSVIQASTDGPGDSGPIWNADVDQVFSSQEGESDNLAELAFVGSHPCLDNAPLVPKLLWGQFPPPLGTVGRDPLPILRC